MKKLVIAATLASLPMVVFAADPIEGKWQTVDDKTGQKRAIVEIKSVGNGTFNGTIISLAPGIDPNCGQCADSQKGKPLLGRVILRGVKVQPDGTYTDGRIVDPQNGKTYSAKAKLTDGGKKLAARGYVGISLLGRTQTWLRVQ